MLKVNVLNLEGTPLREIELAAEVFGIEPNNQAIFDAIMMQRASVRQGTHDVKNRREVRGGGRKPWRQKGTGRARQGSIRSPQWRGGGIVFGPTPRSYAYKLNRKVRRLALKSILSQKAIDTNIVVVEGLNMATPKTKDFVKVMNALNLENKTLFVVSGAEEFDNAFLSLRNLPNAMMLSVEGLNVYDVANADVLVFTETAANLAGEVLA
ncbi:MAG TPA: 50S ribosomal protein L4 [Erysipelotrichaceae bacterium]|nr:50S ribosomal protein L4 [Erysipelotrichaceae bacterium]